MNKAFSKLIYIIAASMIFISCSTIPKDVDEDLDPAEIIIRAQQYSDESKTSAAEMMYNKLLDNYGSDTTYRVIGEYEIAHIKLKQKKYSAAEPLYEDIINIYESTYETLPGKYLLLAQNDLERLREATKYKTTTKKLFTKKEKAKKQQEEEDEENSQAFW